MRLPMASARFPATVLLEFAAALVAPPAAAAAAPVPPLFRKSATAFSAVVPRASIRGFAPPATPAPAGVLRKSFTWPWVGRDAPARSPGFAAGFPVVAPGAGRVAGFVTPAAGRLPAFGVVDGAGRLGAGRLPPEGREGALGRPPPPAGRAPPPALGRASAGRQAVSPTSIATTHTSPNEADTPPCFESILICLAPFVCSPLAAGRAPCCLISVC